MLNFSLGNEHCIPSMYICDGILDQLCIVEESVVTTHQCMLTSSYEVYPDKVSYRGCPGTLMEPEAISQTARIWVCDGIPDCRLYIIITIEDPITK